MNVKITYNFFLAFLLMSNLCLAQQPNVIFIFIDDQGWNGTSHQMDSARTDTKSDYYQTPHVEALAQQGMTFTQAYASAPKCSPSRNSILIGKTTANGQFTNTSSQVQSGQFLSEPSCSTNINTSATTFAEIIKQNNPNYLMAHYGKWHLGSQGPENNGFDRSDGNTGNNDGAQGTGIQSDPKFMYQITDSALTFINDAQAAGRPFFVQLSHYAVHDPLELTQAAYDTFNNVGARPIGAIHDDTLFGGMTEDVDRTVGLLLDSITAWGLNNNTYIVYMSDNGSMNGTSRNAPLSRGKIYLTEGGIRVPFIVRGPNVPANSYSRVPVVGYDLYPTFVDWMLGNTNSVPSVVEGASIKDVALGNSQVLNRNNSLIFHSPHYDQSPNKHPESAIRNDSFKFVVDYETGLFYLYDIINDIEENQDVKNTFPIAFQALCLELRDYLKSTNAQMPTLNDAHPNNVGTAPDADNDGLDDAWEFRELLTHIYTGTDDPDGDGFDNATEFANGTDPHMMDGTNISLINEEPLFKVFPNPASSVLFIEGNRDFDKAILYDYTGRTVLKRSRKNVIKVGKFPAGMYFLVLMKEGQQIYSQEIRIQ